MRVNGKRYTSNGGQTCIDQSIININFPCACAGYTKKKKMKEYAERRVNLNGPVSLTVTSFT